MAFSDAPNAFTKGNEGMLTNRNTMPLFNLAWYAALFWDGRASSIEDQVYHPVRDRNEMNITWKEAENRIKALEFYQHKFRLAFGIQEIDSVLITKAIGQFLRTLISNQSKYDRVLAGNDYLNKDEYAGFVLMNDMTKGDCMHCHTTDGDALGTTGKFSNNGLDNIKEPNMYKDKGLGGYTTKENDNGKFKIPSLRNVAITAPYMHDGRFATLEEVLDFYSDGVQTSANIDAKMGLAHQGGVRLTLSEKKQIIAFLNTLTDSLFIANPKYSNPFKN
jgi:cytochrome c peroxidase